jgi:hypothetical protein
LTQGSTSANAINAQAGCKKSVIEIIMLLGPHKNGLNDFFHDYDHGHRHREAENGPETGIAVVAVLGVMRMDEVVGQKDQTQKKEQTQFP